MPIPGQVTQTTENVEIYLTPTGSNYVDQFNIDIYKWDTGSLSEVLSGSYATGVTPTTLSSYNNHSLVDGYPDGSSGFGYGISGITYDCTKVRLTTSGSYGHCMGGIAEQDLTHAASKIYNPGVESTWTVNFPDAGSATQLVYSNTGPTSGQTTSATQIIGNFITLPWNKAGTPYELYDTGSYFQVSHQSSVDSNGSTITGSYANGPLGNLRISFDITNPDGQHFIMEGSQISGQTQKISNSPVHSIYRIAWSDSGNYYDVDFYYETKQGNE